MLVITSAAPEDEAVLLCLGVMFFPPAGSYLGGLLNMHIFRLFLSLDKAKFIVGVFQSSELQKFIK